MLSATFMNDITGLFGIVVCLYGCLRALQSSSDRTAIAWLCFAVPTNALFGTPARSPGSASLSCFPCPLAAAFPRRVLIAGAATTLAGALFIFACMHWLNHQPYVVPDHLNLLLHLPTSRPRRARLLLPRRSLPSSPRSRIIPSRASQGLRLSRSHSSLSRSSCATSFWPSIQATCAVTSRWNPLWRECTGLRVHGTFDFIRPPGHDRPSSFRSGRCAPLLPIARLRWLLRPRRLASLSAGTTLRAADSRLTLLGINSAVLLAPFSARLCLFSFFLGPAPSISMTAIPRPAGRLRSASSATTRSTIPPATSARQHSPHRRHGDLRRRS